MAESAYFISIGDALNAFPDPGDSVVLQDYAKRTSARLLKIQPADVRPVVDGEWIVDSIADNIFQCSKCGNDAPVSPAGGTEYKAPYCQTCGAKMKNSIAEVE